MLSLAAPGFLKNYTGYIREILTYSSYLFRPKRNPRTKFVIFTVGRTGSNLLVSLLNNNRIIHCHSELLIKRVVFPKLYLKCQERLARKEVYGFKVLLYNFGVQDIQDPLDILGDLYRDGYKIISLKRRNILRQVVSHMYAVHRSKFHLNKGQAEPNLNRMRIDSKYLHSELEFFLDYRLHEEQILTNFSYLQLYYEDDLLDERCHQQAVDKVADYLGIPTAIGTTKLAKTTPQDLYNIIENYDEFKMLVENTGYSQYLDAV